MTFSNLISGTIPHHNKYNQRPGKVARVIQHHWASTSLAGEAALASPTTKKSVNYLVYNDGTIKGQVPEEFRPWTSSGPAADNPSITIEVQNETAGPEWKVSDKAIASITALLADIAKRHGFGVVTRTNYMGHRQFAQTACPGPYLYPRLDAIASEANAIINGGTSVPVTPPSPQPSQRLVVDGQWGANTTWWQQTALHTPADKVISHQWKSAANENIYSAQFDKTGQGSTLGKAVQTRLTGLGRYSGKIDGLLGEQSIRGLQGFYGTPVDGVVSPVSTMVKAMQTEINGGSFLGVAV